MEALVRMPCSDECDRNLWWGMPTHLPEMELFYSSPSTARATLSTVTSMTKWLRCRSLALNLLIDSRDESLGAAAAAVHAAVSGAAGQALGAVVNRPLTLWSRTLQFATGLARYTIMSLWRLVVLLDPETYTPTAAAAAAAPTGRSSRAWLKEKAYLHRLTRMVASGSGPVAPYKAQLATNPQLLGSILAQLQRGVTAQQRAAAAGQADRLAEDHGRDVAALTDQLQVLQVGGSSWAASGSAVVHAATMAPEGALLGDGMGSSSDGGTNADTGGSSAASSAASGVPPVTPGDITVAANALLVACKAAGALCGVPQLLEQGLEELATKGLASRQACQQHVDGCEFLLAAAAEVADWLVLLHPVLVQLLPAEQGQVLVDLGGSSSSNSIKELSAEEVTAVLGALQHVVIPGQPGCSNPRCCCLEGASEAEVETQVCAGCHGTRYCSAACQRAHWRAGHKEVCKAAQAAAKAAGET
jgi:hypothetical protein